MNPNFAQESDRRIGVSGIHLHFDDAGPNRQARVQNAPEILDRLFPAPIHQSDGVMGLAGRPVNGCGYMDSILHKALQQVLRQDRQIGVDFDEFEAHLRGGTDQRRQIPVQYGLAPNELDTTAAECGGLGQQLYVLGRRDRTLFRLWPGFRVAMYALQIALVG
jgi:hypothetical protein